MKKIKTVGIILLVIIICYVGLILIERHRFNNGATKPLVLIGPININIAAGSKYSKETYYGLGYSFEFDCISEKNENSDVQLSQMISGKFKLFNKFIISEWIS